MAVEVEMAAVTVAAVDADLERVTTQQRGKPVAPCQAHSTDRDTLVQQLHAGFLAQAAAVRNRALAGAQCVHPCPDRDGDEEQGDQGSSHVHSVAGS